MRLLVIIRSASWDEPLKAWDDSTDNNHMVIDGNYTYSDDTEETGFRLVIKPLKTHDDTIYN